MSDNEVTLGIEIETSAAEKSLKTLEKNSIDSANKMQKAFDGLKTVAAAAVAVFAGRAVINFFEEGIASAVAQEQAFARLGAQLDATGENTAEAVKAFGDLADELESTTKFGDDAVISAAALAKSYGLTNDQALTLTRTAADLASATGDTLEGAVTQLTASYSGNIKAIGKLVPEIKGLTKEQLAAGGAVDILAKRFKDAASKEIQTYQGAIIQAGNAFDNFRESFGKILVENKGVTASINAISKIFQAFQKITEENAGSLGDFVTLGIQSLVTALSLVLPVTKAVVKAIEGFAFGVSLAITGVLEAIRPLAEALDLLPGSATSTAGALDAITEKSSGVSRSILDGFGKVTKAIDETTVSADKVAQSIFDVTEATDIGMKKAEKSTNGFKRAVILSAEEVAKLREEGKKFLESLSIGAASESEKAIIEAKKSFTELGELRKKGALTEAQTREASFKITQIQIQKTNALIDKSFKETTDKAKQAAQEARAAIESAAADPIRFGIAKLEIPPIQVSFETQQVAAAGVGIVGKILEGAAGAKSLISAGAAAIGDALIPGIGGAVGGIVSKLAEGPEATKKFVKEFVAAIPVIVEAIADSAPVFVEALIDSLVNKGGAIRIGIAIARAMSGEAILKNIGKQIGVSFGDSFNGEILGRKIGNGFLAVGEKLKFAFGGVGVAIVASFALAGKKFSEALGVSFQKIAATFTNIGKILYDSAFSGLIKFGQAFSTIVRLAFTDIGRRIIDAFTHAGNVIYEKIINPFAVGAQLIIGALTAGVNNIVTLFSSLGETILAPIREFFATGLTDAVNQAFGSILDFFQNNLFDSVGAAFKPIIDFLDNFRIEVPGVSALPSKDSGLISGTGTPLDYLAKGGVVYAANGFMQRGTDTVPAMLTPGEMVLNRGQQSELFNLANNGGGGNNELLERIIDLLTQPQTTEVTAQVNGKAIADIVLQQSRQRARLTA